MTDEEIKKALECCFNDECENCPNRGDKFHCFDKVKEEALALINRQQAEIGVYETCNARKDESIRHLEAEIERLKAEIDDLKRDTVPKLQDSLNRANKYGRQADEENARLKAEIERLNGNLFTISNACMQRRNEAIKEFAEKVKNYVKTHCNPYGNPIFDYDTSLKILKYLDNLLAEMAGGENA